MPNVQAGVTRSAQRARHRRTLNALAPTGDPPFTLADVEWHTFRSPHGTTKYRSADGRALVYLRPFGLTHMAMVDGRMIGRRYQGKGEAMAACARVLKRVGSNASG